MHATFHENQETGRFFRWPALAGLRNLSTLLPFRPSQGTARSPQTANAGHPPDPFIYGSWCLFRSSIRATTRGDVVDKDVAIHGRYTVREFTLVGG